MKEASSSTNVVPPPPPSSSSPSSSSSSSFSSSTMNGTARSQSHNTKTSTFTNFLLFLSGVVSAFFLFWFFYSVITTDLFPVFSFPTTTTTYTTNSIYSDPTLSYTITTPLHDWDSKRLQWLNQQKPKSLINTETVLLISASQPNPCPNPIGDHLLLRLFKNKQDYSRLHNLPFFYNTALLHPNMTGYWNKIPTVRSAMVAHPEVEWIWWVDSDAVITDMDFVLPLHKYKDHNLVVHGWPGEVFDKKSWTGLNAGVFLMRNCQWSLDFMDVWAKMGPQTPDYEFWGKTQKTLIKDKLYPEADDQSGLVYLMLMEKEKWGVKIYLENEYALSGYWLGIVGKLENIAKEEIEVERRVEGLRTRHAEVEWRENEVGSCESSSGDSCRRRPFVTHFTGCQPCNGEHNSIYSDEDCWGGMRRTLDFADDQVLRSYGFRHVGLNAGGVLRPLPFDFPVKQ